MEQLPILNCEGCGACCMALGHPQFYRNRNDPHWVGLPDGLKQQINDHIDSLTDIDIGKPCIWLDMESKQCKYYERRPQLCRDFEIGNPHCVRMREAYEID